MDKTKTTTAIQSTSPLWSSLDKDSAIKVWASDLDRVIKNPKDLAVAGQAVVIEAHEEEIAGELIQLVAVETGMSLHVVPAVNVIKNFPKWFDALPRNQPAMVYLQAGHWQGEKFGELNPDAPTSTFDSEKCQEFIECLCELIRTKISSRQVILVTTVKSFSQLNVSLREADMFDRRIQLPKLSDEAVYGVFAEELGHEVLGTSITTQIHKVACLLQDCYPDTRRRKLMQKAMRRLAWRERRTLEYVDLVKFACYGTGEVDAILHDEKERRRNAIHEAGHVVVGHLTSRDKTPAAYCSIIPRDDIGGIVVRAYESHERRSNDLSYRDALHKIKTLLAGRAAEYLLLGADEISIEGASSDLASATELAGSMFGLWGLSDDNSTAEASAKNLSTVINEATASEHAYVESMARQFLQKMYLETIEILEANGDYFQAVIEELMDKNFLMQEEVAEIYARTNNKPRRAA